MSEQKIEITVSPEGATSIKTTGLGGGLGLHRAAVLPAISPRETFMAKSNTRIMPTTTIHTLSTHLHELLSACFTGIWVQTHEPHEAAREITDLCRAESWRLGIWNCDSGVQFPIEQIAISGVTETQDPLAVIRAMPQVSQGVGTSVLLFENLHRFLGSLELIQAVARQAITSKHNRAFIVVLAPVTQIPPELDKLFVCVDHELPDHPQLEEIAREVATQGGELPEGKIWAV